jgi:hypothetical protein
MSRSGVPLLDIDPEDFSLLHLLDVAAATQLTAVHADPAPRSFAH